MAATVSLHHYYYPQICSNKEQIEIPSLLDRFTLHRCSVSPFIAENWMVKIRGFSLFLSAWVLNKWGIRVLTEGSTSPLSSSFFLLLDSFLLFLRSWPWGILTHPFFWFGLPFPTPAPAAPGLEAPARTRIRDIRAPRVWVRVPWHLRDHKERKEASNRGKSPWYP